MTGKENQLKKENQQLRNEIGELKKQLDKLTKEIGHRREEIDPDAGTEHGGIYIQPSTLSTYHSFPLLEHQLSKDQAC